jgi:hypothetical protein
MPGLPVAPTADAAGQLSEPAVDEADADPDSAVSPAPPLVIDGVSPQIPTPARDAGSPVSSGSALSYVSPRLDDSGVVSGTASVVPAASSRSGEVSEESMSPLPAADRPTPADVAPVAGPRSVDREHAPVLGDTDTTPPTSHRPPTPPEVPGGLHTTDTDATPALVHDRAVVDLPQDTPTPTPGRTARPAHDTPADPGDVDETRGAFTAAPTPAGAASDGREVAPGWWTRGQAAGAV